MEVLTNFGLNPANVLTGVVLSALLVFLLYRKFLVSVLEPLTPFMVAQVGNASIMWAVLLELIYKWQFLVYFLCLWSGFALRGKAVSSGPAIVFDRNFLFELTFILTMLCALIVGANLYLGSTAGFPLLSSNPTQAKFTIYVGGLGFVRRINTGPYYLLCAGCSLLIIIQHQKRYALTILFLATSLVMVSGNKSALLPLLLNLSMAGLHRGLSSERLRRSIQKYFWLLLACGIGIALVVTTKEQGGLVGGIQGFVLRLLLAGDGIVFYFSRREVVMGLVDPTVAGYLHNVLSDVEGLLHISEYQPLALGTLIMGGDEGGPNVQYFIQADLFFGPVLGSIYCFTIGYIIAVMRNGFYSSRTTSAIRLSVYLFLAAAAFDLTTEAGLFITELVVMLLFLVPLYLLAKFFRVCLVNREFWRSLSQLTQTS